MSCGEDDPFYSMIEIMRRTKGQSLPPFLIGKVTVTAPLTVQVGDIPITRKNMKINKHLMTGYARQMRLDSTNATGATAAESYSTNDDTIYN